MLLAGTKGLQGAVNPIVQISENSKFICNYMSIKLKNIYKIISKNIFFNVGLDGYSDPNFEIREPDEDGENMQFPEVAATAASENEPQVERNSLPNAENEETPNHLNVHPVNIEAENEENVVIENNLPDNVL